MAYTNIDDPSAYFQVETYTGNSTSPRSITLSGNSDMQPDLTWIKTRTGPYYHYLFDSSRYSGSSYYRLVPSENFTEYVDTVSQLTAFNTDGFTLAGSGSMANVNWSTQNYVAWNWKANGGTTTSVSASGTGSGCVNACTHQANTTAGFSIITYTGRDDQLNNGQESKLTHGLGVAPSVFICKRRDSADDWFYLGGNQSTVNNGWNNAFLSLNDTDAANGNHYTSNTEPDSTYIYLGNEKVNIASATYVGYAFAEKQGYSKFGKYVGNGNANGPFVYTGFKPAWVMVKRSDAAGSSWAIFDNKRSDSGFNVIDKEIAANENSAEYDRTAANTDFLSNGFKIRNTDGWHNTSGGTYIYMAFAENPFVTSTGIPTTAR